MARVELENRLGVPLYRVLFTGTSFTVEPPPTVPPTATVFWQTDDTGSVTYSAVPGGNDPSGMPTEPSSFAPTSPRDAVRPVTLAWQFSTTGRAKYLTQNVAAGLKAEVRERSDGALYMVSQANRRRAPIAPRRRRVLIGSSLLSGLLLIATIATAAANGLGGLGPLPAFRDLFRVVHPTPTTQGQVGSTTNQTLPQLVVSPSDTTTVTCSGSSVAYPAITVSNTGGQTLNWNATTTVTGASVTPSSGSVGTGQSATLQVTQAGPAKAATNVQITSNGGNATVPFQCLPQTHGKLAVSPTSLALGNYCGDGFGGVGVTLRNTGDGSLTWSKGGSGVSLSPARGTLAAGKSASVSVSGTKANGSFGIAWQDGGAGSTFTVTVSTSCNNRPNPPPNGSGSLTVSSTSLPLGNYCGDSFSGVGITLTDTGTGPLTWSAGSGATLSPANGSLAAGASQPVSVSGTKANGSFGINWHDNATGNNYTVTVSTSCNNAPPPHGNLAVNPTSLPLGNYCGDSFSGVGITLTDTGTGPLTWSSPGGSGMGLSPANGSLSAGQAVSVGVSGTKANGSIPINWQDGGSGPSNTLTVSTSCNNAPPPAQLYVQYYTEALEGACGTSTTDNIGNTGGQSLGWSATTDNGISVSPTGGTIAPGQTTIPITIWVSGSPDFTQPAHVYITSDGGNATITINWGCPF